MKYLKQRIDNNNIDYNSVTSTVTRAPVSIIIRYYGKDSVGIVLRKMKDMRKQLK